MVAAGLDGIVKRNADYSWDKFDSNDYFAHNYAKMYDDDRQIVPLIRDFFAEQLGDAPLHGLRGIDVGTGANLYPALAMLPFCEQVTLYEYSSCNVKWLLEGQESNWSSSWPSAWEMFWKLYEERGEYARVKDPRVELKNRCEITPGSIFDLEPPPEGPWDVGTMFFVAESITQSRDEFSAALGCFLDSLASGAPFVIALMKHSVGYRVAGLDFPATDVGNADVAECLRKRTSRVSIEHVGTGNKPLRDGYSGMIVVRGLRD